MIPESAVKRLARLNRVDPAVIDRDHALGIVLWALTAAIPGSGWVLKGGTCLRKCYYPDYRFSEDLDFTAPGPLPAGEAEAVIAQAAANSARAGVRLVLEEMRTTVMNDEYGRESLEIRVPYQGALRMGSRPAVQFHLTADEKIVFAPVARPLLHPYDDSPDVGATLQCYALEEVLAEKLRAVSGQRRHAIARDVYDIAQLLDRGDVDTHAALQALPAKAACKGVDLHGAKERLLAREAEYRTNWSQQLAYLVTDGLEFEAVFAVVAELLGGVGQ
jgi:predicted nucleotidyltransferase component of viral defense system